MTTPAGNPDFQKIVNTRSPNQFTALNQSLAPGLLTGAVIPVANWLSLLIVFTPSAGSGSVRVNHCLDAAGTQIIGTDIFVGNNNTGVLVLTPLRGQFVRIDINNTGAGTLTVLTYASLTSAPASKISYPVLTQTAGANGVTIPASGTINYFVGKIVAGHAWIRFNQTDAPHTNLTVTVDATNSTGVFQFTHFSGVTSATPIEQEFIISDFPCRITVTNTDGAAAHTYDLSVLVPEQP